MSAQTRRRQSGWVPIAAMRSEVESVVGFCQEKREHWRVVSYRPRVRKAWVVIEYEGPCPAEVRRNADLFRRLVVPKPDPTVWQDMLPARLAVKA